MAGNFLVSRGYEIIEKNYFNKKGYRIGEIDLIAKDRKKKLVFVEVKARKGNAKNLVPEENITGQKIKKLYKIINRYLKENDCWDKEWRLDSVAVCFDFETRKLSIRHIKNIRI